MPAALMGLLALLLTSCGTPTSASTGAPGPGRASDRPAGHHAGHRPGEHGWPSPVEMHALTGPRPPGSDRATTYGLGDLDGDGRDDLVEVRTDGRVSVELTWLGHRSARLPADPTLRLQGLPDLDGDGRAEVLVAATAAGCCGGYRLPETRSAVLRVHRGRLQPLRWATGGPMTIEFDRGRGDLWAGVRCGQDGLHLVQALDEGATARLTDTTVGITGLVARRGPAVERTVPVADVGAETRSRCPGLDAQGWAA